MAPRKPKVESTALVNWEAELAEAASEQTVISAPSGGGNMISFKSGRMSYKGEDIVDNTIEVVILDSVYENQFYTEDYDSDNPASPSCYAFARKEDELQPHEECEDPVSPTCAKCPKNEWGSADKGKGKACKNVMRLACIPSDALDNPADIAGAEVAYMKIPVMSVANWEGFATKMCSKHPTGAKPSYYYVVEVSLVPDEKSQFRVMFKDVENLEQRDNGSAEFKALRAKVKDIADDIMFAYPKTEDLPKPTKTTKNRKFSKR